MKQKKQAANHETFVWQQLSTQIDGTVSFYAIFQHFNYQSLQWQRTEPDGNQIKISYDCLTEQMAKKRLKLKCPRDDDDERIEKKSLDELVKLRCFQ